MKDGKYQHRNVLAIAGTGYVHLKRIVAMTSEMMVTLVYKRESSMSRREPQVMVSLNSFISLSQGNHHHSCRRRRRRHSA